MINDTIVIDRVDEVVDNWGRTNVYTKNSDILLILQKEEDWTDDMTFFDNRGNTYSIDDLIGKRIRVGDKEFLVCEEGIDEMESYVEDEDDEEEPMQGWELEPDEKTRKIMEEIHKIIDPVLKLKEAVRELVAKYPNDTELGKSIRRLNLD